MTVTNDTVPSLRHAKQLFIDGSWVDPSSRDTIDVTDSTNESVFLSVAEAKDEDVAKAVEAARRAFDEGPWARMSHLERAGYLRALADGLRERAADLGQLWPRESGVLHSVAQYAAMGGAATFEYYAGTG